MIRLLTTMLLALSVNVMAQTNLRTVMVNNAGSVERPTNLWSANSTGIVAALTNAFVSVNNSGQLQTPSNFWTANASSIAAALPQEILIPASLHQSPMANLTVFTNNANASVTNGIASLQIEATTTNGNAGIRLLQDVNSRSAAGIGTAFNAQNHKFTIVTELGIAQNGLFRAVLGSGNASTNLGAYPSNEAIALEIDKNNSTNRVRLVAHNGTTATNGPWVTFGDDFQRYTFVVSQNKTNGVVQLLLGVNYAAPVLQTAATISGGPTGNAPINADSLDVRLSTTNTNSFNLGVTILRAFVEVTQ